MVSPGGVNLATRLYSASGACEQLRVVDGACPRAAGEVMVSSGDVADNGWTVGTEVDVTERVDLLFDGPSVPAGTVTVVGVYAPEPDDDWLGAPLTGRVGREVQDVGLATDDWVTVEDTVLGSSVATWYRVTSSVAWPLDTVDHDDLVAVGPIVTDYRTETTEQAGNTTIRIETDLPSLSQQVADGSDQGRTTVVVLVAQLLVLIGVVLWMVLVAATDDRRPEVALARLRGRGRRGAAAYLLAELLPLTLSGVAIGVLVAPLAMNLVGRVVFPVTVPLELPDGFLLAALGSTVAVLLVVLAASRRAVREPVDSLLRAVQARHTGTGAGAAEITMIVFSLTAVVALVTGNLEGPLATLAPTLLAVAVGLLLGRALAPATRAVSRRLLRSGRAVAAAGIVNAVRRPAARRILVMVVVASALFVFCVDALVTGKLNRQNAAEQENGARLLPRDPGRPAHRRGGRRGGGRPGPRAPHLRGDVDAGLVGRGVDRRRRLDGVPPRGLLHEVQPEPRGLGGDRRAGRRPGPADRHLRRRDGRRGQGRPRGPLRRPGRRAPHRAPAAHARRQDRGGRPVPDPDGRRLGRVRRCGAVRRRVHRHRGDGLDPARGSGVRHRRAARPDRRRGAVLAGTSHGVAAGQRHGRLRDPGRGPRRQPRRRPQHVRLPATRHGERVGAPARPGTGECGRGGRVQRARGWAGPST